VTQGQGWLWGAAVGPADFAAHWHAGGPAARAAAAGTATRRNERGTPPMAKKRNQLPAGNA